MVVNKYNECLMKNITGRHPIIYLQSQSNIRNETEKNVRHPLINQITKYKKLFAITDCDNEHLVVIISL